MTLLPGPWPEDARLVEVYDVECAGGIDHDFYLAVADELEAEVIVDVGCGTGRFAVDAATSGRQVIGTDPARAMIDFARRRPRGAAVDWLHGGPEAVAEATVDLAVMMGHVAQYFVADDHWASALGAIRRMLRPGGSLAFETRNPAVDWLARWVREETEVTMPHPGGGRFTSWVEVQDKAGLSDSYTITHEGNTVLPNGDHLRVLETLRFRSRGEIEASLDAAGLEPVQLWGHWDRTPFMSTSDELIVVARARS